MSWEKERLLFRDLELKYDVFKLENPLVDDAGAAAFVMMAKYGFDLEFPIDFARVVIRQCEEARRQGPAAIQRFLHWDEFVQPTPVWPRPKVRKFRSVYLALMKCFPEYPEQDGRYVWEVATGEDMITSMQWCAPVRPAVVQISNPIAEEFQYQALCMGPIGIDGIRDTHLVFLDPFHGITVTPNLSFEGVTTQHYKVSRASTLQRGHWYWEYLYIDAGCFALHRVP